MRPIKPSGTSLFAFSVKHFFDFNEIQVLRCNITSKSAQHKFLTLRLLMSYIYIYGAPILDVSRSHNNAPQSVGLLWTSDQLVAETST